MDGKCEAEKRLSVRLESQVTHVYMSHTVGEGFFKQTVTLRLCFEFAPQNGLVGSPECLDLVQEKKYTMNSCFLKVCTHYY